MTLKCINSGSKGNCYLLTSSRGDTLVLECGVTIKELKKALGFSIKNVAGCIVTHQHDDHAKALKDVVRLGIPVLALDEVFIAKKALGFNCMTAQHKKAYKMGNFKVSAYNAMHDVPCLMYVIEHEEMGKLLFATDTYKIPYGFKGLDHLMVECNYADDILDYNIEHETCPVSLRNRLMESHMELKGCIKAVRDNTSDNTQDVVLIHLSHDNACAEHFARMVSSRTGIPTYVAEKNFDCELTNSNNPY